MPSCPGRGMATAALRLSPDGGSTWRTANYQYAASIFNTASGSQITRYAGFNISDETAFWLYINHRPGHPGCLDLTLTAPRDATRKTAWSYALMQHHVAESGRGGFGGGLYLADQDHDALQILMLGGRADVGDYNVTLHGVLRSGCDTDATKMLPSLRAGSRDTPPTGWRSQCSSGRAGWQ